MVELQENGEAVCTNLETLEVVLKEKADDLVCVLSTTSCFAPRYGYALSGDYFDFLYSQEETFNCFHKQVLTPHRIPDDVVGIAKLCAKYKVPHVVNNAYGLSCSKICHQLELAMKQGRYVLTSVFSVILSTPIVIVLHLTWFILRVDAIVQSTDKNFMVPVGGAIVSGPNKKFIEIEYVLMYGKVVSCLVLQFYGVYQSTITCSNVYSPMNPSLKYP